MRRFKAPLLWFALVLIMSVPLLQAGCGSGSEELVKTYTDSEYGFSFGYPKGWDVAESQELKTSSGSDPVAEVTVADPDGAKAADVGLDVLMVRVYELAFSVDESAMTDLYGVLEQVVIDLQSYDPTIVIELPLAETNVGGLPGYQFTATLDMYGTTVRTTSYFIFDGFTEYQLIVQASLEDWEQDQQVFTDFVSTFRAAGSTD